MHARYITTDNQRGEVLYNVRCGTDYLDYIIHIQHHIYKQITLPIDESECPPGPD